MPIRCSAPFQWLYKHPFLTAKESFPKRIYCKRPRMHSSQAYNASLNSIYQISANFQQESQACIASLNSTNKYPLAFNKGKKKSWIILENLRLPAKNRIMKKNKLSMVFKSPRFEPSMLHCNLRSARYFLHTTHTPRVGLPVITSHIVPKHNTLQQQQRSYTYLLFVSDFDEHLLETEKLLVPKSPFGVGE